MVGDGDQPERTDEAWRYLQTLPRVTLAQRIAYWELRHALEEEGPHPGRVRPYIASGRSATVGLAGPQHRLDRRRTEM